MAAFGPALVSDKLWLKFRANYLYLDILHFFYFCVTNYNTYVHGWEWVSVNIIIAIIADQTNGIFLFCVDIYTLLRRLYILNQNFVGHTVLVLHRTSSVHDVHHRQYLSQCYLSSMKLSLISFPLSLSTVANGWCGSPMWLTALLCKCFLCRLYLFTVLSFLFHMGFCLK